MGSSRQRVFEGCLSTRTDGEETLWNFLAVLHIADNCDKFKKNLHRTSEIQEFLPLESEILSLRFRNTAQGIRNPTNDWIARIL